MSSAHSMNARKCVHAQKPYPCQVFAHESSKVGGRGKSEEESRDVRIPKIWPVPIPQNVLKPIP